MSVIIGEGITTEIEHETTADGHTIYMIFGQIKTELPKIVHEGAGELVLTYTEATDTYSVSPQVDFSAEPYYLTEKDSEGNTVYITMPDAEGNLETIALPSFLRTEDGTTGTPVKQGYVVLDDSGAPQMVRKQVSNLDVIWKNGIIMILITLLSSIASIGVAYVSSKVGMYFGRDIRKNLFRKTVYFSQEQENKFGTASLITRMTNDVMQMQNITMMSMRMMINVPIVFVGGIIMAYRKDPEMMKVLFISAPVVLLFIGVVAANIVPIFKKMQKRIDNMTLVARENITGVRVIRAFNQDERENKRFDHANKQVTGLAIKAARIMAVLFPAMQLIMSLTAIAVVAIAVQRVNAGLQAGSIDFTMLGNMMAVIQYMIQIMFSLVMFSIIFILVPRASVSANRINEVLESENNIVDPKTPLTNSIKGGEIEFKGVNFAFPGAAANVLSDINLSVKSGETVAIIGSTGSGKSTLINLIPRLYDVTEGTVLLDGVDVRDYKQDELRGKIGFISQKAILFEGSIRDNIRYGRPDATEEEILQAAEISQAKDFIEEYEDGLDHRIDQGGANLSGGQKQRLAIARAICRRPEVYIFDDSFSALDFKTDKKLRSALKKITSGSTVIIVAQRIGTIMNADKIIVIHDGKIVGTGKHKQLLRDCEVYKEIAISQMSEEELMRSGLETAGGAL
jgi:ATP-binding cassette subfamily B protein